MQRPVPREFQSLRDGTRMLFDAHCHVFNHECVPNGYLGIRLPFTDKFLTMLEKLAKFFGKVTDEPDISNAGYFVGMFKKDCSYIRDKMMSYYPAETIFCPLSVNFDHSIKGSEKYSFQQQVDILGKMQDAMPGRIIPFLCLNPRDPKMEDQFHTLICSGASYKGFWGVKIYPALGYKPSHPRLITIFKECAEMGIPVIAHCSTAAVHTTDRHLTNIPYTKIVNGVPVLANDKSKWFWSKDDYSEYFNHPKNWEVVLQLVPNLKLDLAHFGGFGSGTNSWASRIIDMMGRYPNLYTDVAYVMADRKKHVGLRALLEANQLVRKRVLYGSDYYMVVLEDHFRASKIDFFTAMGDELMSQIARTNVQKFLFG